MSINNKRMMRRKMIIVAILSSLMIIIALFVLINLSKFKISATGMIFFNVEVIDSNLSFEVSQTDTGYSLQGYSYLKHNDTIVITFYGTFINKFALKNSNITISIPPDVTKFEVYNKEQPNKVLWEQSSLREKKKTSLPDLTFGVF